MQVASQPGNQGYQDMKQWPGCEANVEVEKGKMEKQEKEKEE